MAIKLLKKSRLIWCVPFLLDKPVRRYISDQGWQYQHKYYVNELKKHGVKQSMSRKGNCYDNSIMETFFGRLKNEVYYGYEKSYRSFGEFSKVIEEYRLLQ